ncbi:hypothetical protein ACWGS9_04295 [Bradyrhizobium sp. Arg314]
MQRFRNLLGLVISLALLLGLAVWFVGGFARLSRSILPGVPTSASRSMELREFVFRYDAASQRDSQSGKIAEWKLAIPKAFLWAEVGSDSSIAGRPGENSLHGAHLYALLDTVEGKFSPATLADPAANRADRFFIELTNARTAKALSDSHRCLRNDEVDDLLNAGPALRSPPCDPDKRTVRCESRLSYKGWSIRLSVPKKYYAQQQEVYCEPVLKFLIEHTVAIDEIDGP